MTQSVVAYTRGIDVLMMNDPSLGTCGRMVLWIP